MMQRESWYEYQPIFNGVALADFLISYRINLWYPLTACPQWTNCISSASWFSVNNVDVAVFGERSIPTMLLTIEGTNYVSADVFTDGKKCSSYSNAVISDHEMQGWIIVETGQLITIHSRVRSSQVMCQVDLVVDGVIRNSTIHGLSGRGNPPAQASIHTFYTAAYQAGEGQEQREMYAQPLNLGWPLFSRTLFGTNGL